MNHKKRKSKNQRSGCKLCKPWKINSVKFKNQHKPSELRILLGFELDIKDGNKR